MTLQSVDHALTVLEILRGEDSFGVRETLVALARVTDETANLAMLDGHDALYMDCVPARYRGAIPSRAGMRIDRTSPTTTPRERELVLRLRAASAELQTRLAR